MKRGHPSLTNAFDKQRAEQRCKLRAVPDWVFTPDRLKPFGPLTKIEDDDRALVETVFREFADTAANHVGAVVGIPAGTRETERLLGGLQPDWPPELDEVRELLRHAPRTRELTDDEEIHLRRFVYLAAIADELAGDYTDPRLASWFGHGH